METSSSLKSLKLKMFPSPCGVMVIGNCIAGVDAHVHNGLGKVSVPLRGNGYRKFRNASAVISSLCTVFPSPCGVMVIGNNPGENSEFLSDGKVSVPLRGNGYRKYNTSNKI